MSGRMSPATTTVKAIALNEKYTRLEAVCDMSSCVCCKDMFAGLWEYKRKKQLERSEKGVKDKVRRTFTGLPSLMYRWYMIRTHMSVVALQWDFPLL